MVKYATKLIEEDPCKKYGGGGKGVSLARGLHGQAVGVLLEEIGDVVKAVKVRKGLRGSARLDQLFSATVEEAKLRIYPRKNLTMDLQVEAHNAVRGGVLGTKV